MVFQITVIGISHDLTNFTTSRFGGYNQRTSTRKCKASKEEKPVFTFRQKYDQKFTGKNCVDRFNFRFYIYLYIKHFIKNHISIHQTFGSTIFVQGILQKNF